MIDILPIEQVSEVVWNSPCRLQQIYRFLLFTVTVTMLHYGHEYSGTTASMVVVHELCTMVYGGVNAITTVEQERLSRPRLCEFRSHFKNKMFFFHVSLCFDKKLWIPSRTRSHSHAQWAPLSHHQKTIFVVEIISRE
jgi:hypothetical protein